MKDTGNSSSSSKRRKEKGISVSVHCAGYKSTLFSRERRWNLRPERINKLLTTHLTGGSVWLRERRDMWSRPLGGKTSSYVFVERQGDMFQLRRSKIELGRMNERLLLLLVMSAEMSVVVLALLARLDGCFNGRWSLLWTSSWSWSPSLSLSFLLSLFLAQHVSRLVDGGWWSVAVVQWPSNTPQLVIECLKNTATMLLQGFWRPLVHCWVVKLTPHDLLWRFIWCSCSFVTPLPPPPFSFLVPFFLPFFFFLFLPT